VILPAENRQNVEEDLTADQIDGVTIHYASRIDDVLAVALPKSMSEERKDEAVREEIIEHAGA
jgi:ATP-dependent Lon protease